ncbi:MAG: hypothetical protein IPK26_09170 [Planctomycetes bacterium]|nr:hypothetical protein [Planctomycetota bacterium]
MAFDSVRGVVVLFGGSNIGTANHDDTWEWNGVSWTEALPAQRPQSRRGTAMQYDSRRSRMVLFGGIDNNTYLNDTWEWDGLAWTQRPQSGSWPSSRDYHAMAFDQSRGAMVCYGGWNGTTVFNETWEWDGTAWTLRSLTTNATRLQNHGMVFDSNRSVLVIYGGWNTGNPGYRDDTWEWDGGPQGWVLRNPASRPPARRGHVMVYDAARARTVVNGGHLGGQILNGDTWEWDGTNWTQRLPVLSPAPHVVASAAYDSTRREIIGTSMGGTNDTWRYVPTVPADVRALGQGCPGAAGVPSLASNPADWPRSLPWYDSSCAVEMTNLGSNPPNVPFLAVGFSSTSWAGMPLPLNLAVLGIPNCTLYVEPVLTISLANNGGRAEWSLAAAGPAFLGFRLFAQGFVLDTSVVPPRVAASNYCELVIGGR